MFRWPALRIARIFGIPVEIDPTWLVIFALVTATLSFSYFPIALPGRSVAVHITAGVLTALLFFASIVAHEFSHSIVARTGGVKISKITLFAFGGVAQMDEEPHGPGSEFLMAIAGPGMSLVLAAAFALGAWVIGLAGLSDLIKAPMEYLAVINLSVAVFNMLPGFPLDGGRVLRAAIWGVTGDLLRATRWASRAGRVLGYGLVVVAAYGIARGTFDFVWLGIVGWFIATLAGSAYRRQVVQSDLHRITTSSIMTPDPVMVPGDITLDVLTREFLLGGRHSKYPVVSEGHVVGLITLDAVRRVPQGAWTSTSVLQAARLDLVRLTVDADAPADLALKRLAEDAPGALLVVRAGMVVGILTRADIVARLRSIQGA